MYLSPTPVGDGTVTRSRHTRAGFSCVWSTDNTLWRTQQAHACPKSCRKRNSIVCDFAHMENLWTLANFTPTQNGAQKRNFSTTLANIFNFSGPVFRQRRHLVVRVQKPPNLGALHADLQTLLESRESLANCRFYLYFCHCGAFDILLMSYLSIIPGPKRNHLVESRDLQRKERFAQTAAGRQCSWQVSCSRPLSSTDLLPTPPSTQKETKPKTRFVLSHVSEAAETSGVQASWRRICSLYDRL